MLMRYGGIYSPLIYSDIGMCIPTDDYESMKSEIVVAQWIEIFTGQLFLLT